MCVDFDRAQIFQLQPQTCSVLKFGDILWYLKLRNFDNNVANGKKHCTFQLNALRKINWVTPAASMLWLWLLLFSISTKVLISSGIVLQLAQQNKQFEIVGQFAGWKLFEYHVNYRPILEAVQKLLFEYIVHRLPHVQLQGLCHRICHTDAVLSLSLSP